MRKRTKALRCEPRRDRLQATQPRRTADRGQPRTVVRRCTGGSSRGRFGPPEGGCQHTAFSACMRSQGEPSFPDPNSNGTITFRLRGDGIDPSSPRFPVRAGGLPEAVAERRRPRPRPGWLRCRPQAHLRFSACMRSHRCPDFPDPSFSMVEACRSGSTRASGGTSSRSFTGFYRRRRRARVTSRATSGYCQTGLGRRARRAADDTGQAEPSPASRRRRVLFGLLIGRRGDSRRGRRSWWLTDPFGGPAATPSAGVVDNAPDWARVGRARSVGAGGGQRDTRVRGHVDRLGARGHAPSGVGQQPHNRCGAGRA